MGGIDLVYEHGGLSGELLRPQATKVALRLQRLELLVHPGLDVLGGSERGSSAPSGVGPLLPGSFVDVLNDKGVYLHKTPVQSGQAMEAYYPAGEIYRDHFDRGSAVLDPPPAHVDSMIDGETGRLHFGSTGGGLLALPPHPHFPPLVAGAVELVNELGGWLGQLPARAGAVATIGTADDKAVAAAKLIHEVEVNAAKWGDQLRAKIAVMRDTATRLATSLREESESDLPPEVARRLVDHFLALDASDRSAFVRQATHAKDWRTLRALGTDPLMPYAARAVNRVELLDAAGAARHPRTAAMMAAYSMLADRLERNLPKITEATQKAVGIATVGVDPGKLKLAQRAAASARPTGLPTFP